MAASGKPRTTRAKLQRETLLRERRLEKEARKLVRKQSHVDPSTPDDFGAELPETGVEALAPDLDALVSDLEALVPGMDALVPSAEPPASI